MNEQNNLNQNTQQGTNGVIAPTNIQGQTGQVAPQPTIDPLPVPNIAQQAAPQVQVNPQVQAAPQVQTQAPQPVQGQVAPQPQPQVVQTVAPQQVAPQVQAPAPAPQTAQQPVQQTTPAPVQVAQPAPTPVQVAPVTPSAPVSPAVTDIQAPAQPINPIQQQEFSNPTPMQPQPHPGVIGPSIPLEAGTDATSVGFVPASSTIPKKKNKTLILCIVLGIISVVGVLGYFVVYPYVLRTFFSDPINVYETTIDGFYKGINATTNDIIHSKAIYDISLTIDSNIEAIKDFSGYSYGVNVGVDPDKQLLQSGFQIKNLDNDNEYSVFEYIKDGKEYIKFSNNRGYIYNGEIDNNDDIFEKYKDLFDKADNLQSEDITYLLEKLSELTKGSIQKDKLSKEDTTITINGETVKVTNNKYEVTEKDLYEMYKYIIDGLLDDSKSIEIITKLGDIESEADTKKALKELKSISEDDIDKDLVYTFNIYTFGNKSEIIGFGIQTSDNSFEIQYYNKDNYFELNAKTEYENDLTGKLDETTLSIVGSTDNNKTNVSIKYNGSEVLTLVITEWNDIDKELSYTFKYDAYKINGKITTNYDINDDRIKFKFYGEGNTGDEYIKITLNVNEDWSSDVANINTDNASTLTDEEFASIQSDFIKSLQETPIKKLLQTFSGDYGPGIGDYYGNGFDIKDDNNNNSNDDENNNQNNDDPEVEIDDI